MLAETLTCSREAQQSRLTRLVGPNRLSGSSSFGFPRLPPRGCTTALAIAQVRGSNKLMLGEAERSIHDALCVIRCLVKKKFVIAGECMLAAGCCRLSIVFLLKMLVI